MTQTEFSIALATNRDIKALEPLFRTTDEKCELVIVDSKWSEEKRDWLSKQKGYAQIVYARPPYEYRTKHSRDFERATNQALMFCESYWILRGDDFLEFKSDFFEKARESRDYFKELYGHEKFGVIGQKLWGSQKQEKWNDYSGIQSSARYVEVMNPQVSFSFGLIPMTLLQETNGWDELYDNAWGYPDDIDFLLRAMTAGYKWQYDRELMGYSEPHNNEAGLYSLNHIIWQFQREQILNGKVRAFNEYDFRYEQPRYLAIKDQFIIK